MSGAGGQLRMVSCCKVTQGNMGYIYGTQVPTVRRNDTATRSSEGE